MEQTLEDMEFVEVLEPLFVFVTTDRQFAEVSHLVMVSRNNISAGVIQDAATTSALVTFRMSYST